MKYIILYLIVINALSFLLMIVDKHRAKKNLWRIPERTLLTTAILGGSLGALVAMYLVRHKTRHRKFSVGVPVILGIQIVAGIFLYGRFFP